VKPRSPEGFCRDQEFNWHCDLFATDNLEIEWKSQGSGKNRQLSAIWSEAIWSAFCGLGRSWIFAVLNWAVAVCLCGLRKRCCGFEIDAERLSRWKRILRNEPMKSGEAGKI
jgi:hypothetical protein